MTKDFKKYCVIKNIHNAEDYYHNLRDMYANCDSIKYNERVSEYLDSEDVALETMKNLAKEYVADDKEIVVEFATIEVRFEDIEDEDFDIENENFDNYYWDYCAYDSIYVEYDYKSLDGALLIVWSWEKYIGYARNFIELRLGTDREDETLLLKEDRVYRPQVDILLTADEMEKMSSKDIENYLYNELLDNGWKWTNPAAVEREIEIGSDD